MQSGRNGNRPQSAENGADRMTYKGKPVYRINEVVGHEVDLIQYEYRTGPYGEYMMIWVRDRKTGEESWIMTGAKVICKKVERTLTNYDRKPIVRIIYKDPYYDIEWLKQPERR